jgi:hypothetical protein
MVTSLACIVGVFFGIICQPLGLSWMTDPPRTAHNIVDTLQMFNRNDSEFSATSSIGIVYIHSYVSYAAGESAPMSEFDKEQKPTGALTY